MSGLQTHVALPDRYRVERHLANGGMASVWAARDEVLERVVAVKVLAPGYAADPAARRRFTREARAAARVSDHPHVVTIYDIGESTDAVPQAFIVMELLAGGTVADRLRTGGPVPTALALRWLDEAGQALDAAHAADIVHRDVKPGNLLLDEAQRLAVGDFGIASLAGSTQVTQAGQVLGTAAYLSPEQARGHAATPASDRYSLAVVAYELLCGHRPFGGETPMAQARAHVEAEPPTPTGPCEAAAAVLRHGLSKDPAQRPASAADFVARLRDVLGVRAPGMSRFARSEPVTAPTVSRAPAPPAPPPPHARAPEEDRTRVPPGPVARPRRRRGAAIAGVAALCIAGGTAAALIGDEGNQGGSGTAGSPTVRRSSAQRSSGAAVRAPATTAAPAASTPAATTAAPATTAPAPATDGRSAAELNNAGYAMLPGDPAGALPLLQRAADAFRASGDHSSTDYAYNLYNLGWALRLSGRPAEAIPLLQERLRISNDQRGTVEKELRTAQRLAGQDPAGTPPGRAKGKGKDGKGAAG
ncbi:serine/threonine-protein kinase [Baekduia soli]|nr:serine/threonine-protein kinase [Baekduia soli]